MDSGLILQTFVNGVVLALLYLLVALGLTLLFSIMEIMNFAHGEMLMLGSFVSYYIMARFPLTGSKLANFILALLLAILIVAAIGTLFERVLFRPLRGRVLEMLIMSVGLSVVLQSFAYMAFGTMDKSVPQPITGSVFFLGAILPAGRILIIIGGSILVSVLFYLVHRTKLGMAMRAIEQDSETAAMMGIRPNRINPIAFAVASGLAGAAGVFISSLFIVNPVMGTEFLLKAFVVIILGGAGSIVGSVAGALVLGFIDSFAGTIFGAHIAYGVGFAIIIIVLLVRPRGLIGNT